MPPLDITIPKTSTSPASEGKPYTIYHVALRAPSSLRAVQLPKRYSDFLALHAALRSEHHAGAGADPPQPLPGKSWFSRTVNNDALTEQRRAGLEAYLRGIEDAGDSRWRDSAVYREFLELEKHGLAGSGGGGGGGGGGGAAAAAAGVLLRREPITTAAGWLDGHAELKARLQEARLCLARREQATAASAQHEAGAAAKKCLVQGAALIAALDEGLVRLAGKNMGESDEGGWGRAETLGDGELRRRKDLLSTARKEREGLEGVLNAMAVRSAVASVASSAVGGSGAATEEAKAASFQSGNASSTSVPSTGRGRVLGGPAKETERTRELDNEGVLQLQKQIMAEQDQDVNDLARVVRRMREMGVQINEEIVAQNMELDLLGQDVDRVDSKIRIAKKRADKIR